MHIHTHVERHYVFHIVGLRHNELLIQAFERSEIYTDSNKETKV